MRRNLIRRAVAAVTVGALLALAACAAIVGTPRAAESLDGSDPAPLPDDPDDLPDADDGADGPDHDDGPGPGPDGSTGDPGEGGSGEQPGDRGDELPGGSEQGLYLALPTEREPPQGWVRSPVYCSVTAAERAQRNIGGVWLSFAYPQAWDYLSSRGDDTPQFGKERTTELSGPDGDWTILVEHRWGEIPPHARGDDLAEATGLHGDHLLVYDDQSQPHEIPFAPVTTITVADQQVGMYVADASDAPEWVTGTTFRAVVLVLGMPIMGSDQGRGVQAVAVNVISHQQLTDEAERAAAADIAATLISSLTMPQCTIDHLVIEWETVQGADLDGDGYVSTQDDWKDMLDRYEE